MASDHHVVSPDRLARPLNLCPKLTVMTSGTFGKRENLQACTELLDDREIFMRACRFFRAIDQLGESDNRDAKLIPKAIEALT